MDGNAYITINDPYKDEVPNPFRNTKRGKDEKPLVPFQIKVASCSSHSIYSGCL